MLNNTRYRLQHDKKLSIGYFGGSITEGAGASKGELCWRGLTGAWFQKTFADCDITTINAAIGGTGSDLGIYRLENDLLSKHPDLVFIEFTVNDSGAAYEETLANSETIVRKIYEQNPYADIIYVHTMTSSMSDCLAAGGELKSRTAHSAVMHHYGIPQIDMGEILRTRILAEGGNWLTYTKEGVHPLDNGYAIYGDAVIEFLSKQLLEKTASELATITLPSPLCTAARIKARLEDAAVAVGNGWTLVADRTLCGRYPHYIEATEPGATLQYSFTGRRIGIYMMLAKDSGDIEYSIDGGELRNARTWDHYCKSFNRAGGCLLSGELPEGEHVLTLRVSSIKAEESEGTSIRIGAFMIY